MKKKKYDIKVMEKIFLLRKRKERVENLYFEIQKHFTNVISNLNLEIENLACPSGWKNNLFVEVEK